MSLAEKINLKHNFIAFPCPKCLWEYFKVDDHSQNKRFRQSEQNNECACGRRWVQTLIYIHNSRCTNECDELGVLFGNDGRFTDLRFFSPIEENGESHQSWFPTRYIENDKRKWQKMTKNWQKMTIMWQKNWQTRQYHAVPELIFGWP